MDAQPHDAAAPPDPHRAVAKSDSATDDRSVRIIPEDQLPNSTIHRLSPEDLEERYFRALGR